MRKLPSVLIIIACFLFTTCNFPALRSNDADEIDSIEIMRYDRVEARYLTTGDFSALQEMNTTYPMQTRALIEDLLQLGSVNDININEKLLDFFQDTTLQVIVFTAESEFADMGELTNDLKTAFRNMKKEFPNAEIPKFYAQIGALNQSIVVDNNVIGISLDKYLGEDFPIYKRYFEVQQRKVMTREYIVPDVMTFYLLSSYGTFEYVRTSQHWRDVNMGIVMYITNKLTGKDIFSSDYIDRVEDYMRDHPNTSLKNLIEMTDYSEI